MKYSTNFLAVTMTAWSSAPSEALDSCSSEEVGGVWRRPSGDGYVCDAYVYTEMRNAIVAQARQRIR